MEFKDIKKIVEMMKANELSEFELEEDAFRISIKRKNGGEMPVVFSQAAPVAMPAAASGGATAGAAAPPSADAAAASEADDEAGLERIASPMVGTFYRSPSPDTDSFVKVGDTVDEETVVCIIEAMKVMNEIKAEKKGVIKKILLENATPVEFGEPLFLIGPA